ncbi:zinc ribbon domain-containing protein [Massilia sp. MS-15]|uniref:zinc ribbon domain-containing protein n=1 Tax=Massilia sp. MS-15 TaxID=2878200 RepID=UPI001CD73C08|nr:zinc ribbon domain-containing protein [Massilia sp. MS-15]MCA1247887.1 zinc ribbon domain-containing protein [Massilia sp. MS-15]
MAHQDTVYRCIAPHCGRLMPRRVNFCPWCGTAQQAALPVADAPVLAKAAVQAPAQPAPAPAPPAQAPVPAPAAVPAAAAGATPSPAPAAPTQPPPASRHAPGIPPPPGVGRHARAEPTAAPPPRRAPIRLRWWILALAALWIIWLSVRPEGTRIERRMDRAVALAVECKARDAQDELIALRRTRATPEQLRQVQQSLNKAAADCTRAEQRARAWSDTSAAVDKLRRARSYDKALARLATFTKRWGEDTQSRTLRQDILDARDHPLADPTRGE